MSQFMYKQYNLVMKSKRDAQLAVLEILKEYSDDEHILTTRDIVLKLKDIYGIDIERRTIYSIVKSLQELDNDISSYQDNGIGYYLRDREFTKAETFVLCNVIHASNFIPKNDSKKLIKSLLATQSSYARKEFQNTVFIENTDKKNDQQFFDNFEILSNAIKKKKTITFEYMKYDEYLRSVPRREELYHVSPVYLATQNGTTYLASKSSHHEGFVHYRLDRMQNIQITDEKYIRPSRDEDPYVYFKTKTHMYSGNPTNVDIKVNKEKIDILVDEFGKDICLRPDKQDKTKMLATIKTTDDGIVKWALQFADCTEVVKPEKIRKKISEALKEAAEKYKD